MGWLKQILSRRRRYDELAESIREHLEEKIEDLMEAGLSREEATYKARREFGNTTLIEERSREVWQWPRLESFIQDLRFGARMLLKNPVFTLVVVITLALGIGANTAIFSWLKAIYLEPLPGVAESHRLVMLRSTWIKSGNSPTWVSYPNYKDYRDRNEVFSGLAAFNNITFNLVDGKGQPERIWGSLVRNDSI
jgi:putative ABC transport system permease protein